MPNFQIYLFMSLSNEFDQMKAFNVATIMLWPLTVIDDHFLPVCLSKKFQVTDI